MNDKVVKALGYVDESYISDAAQKKKKHRKYWIGAAAAALALAFLFHTAGTPLILTAHAVATASGSHRAAGTAQTETESLSGLEPFFTAGSAQFLGGGDGENRLWSPVNAYIGLAMVTELTEGESRRQILDLFGAEDADALRRQVSAVWESTYRDEKGREVSSLANSLWLEKGLSYQRKAINRLADDYHASVYRGDLGSATMNRAIAVWLDSNTGGLLKDAAQKIDLAPETVLALYSTIYFQAKWSEQFSRSNNTTDVFHAFGGDVTATFLNKKSSDMYYYWGDTFSAVSLSLKNGSSMWFILPDEGCSTGDVLSDGQYMEMLVQQDWENKKYMMVNLSVPKFDVSSTMDLKDGLQQLGVTDVFTMGRADFSAITGDTPLFLSAANQSVRVQIDEEGVKAAAYIELPLCGSAAPPDEIIDFVVDRPFLFAITKSSIPLFMGTVHQP